VRVSVTNPEAAGVKGVDGALRIEVDIGERFDIGGVVMTEDVPKFANGVGVDMTARRGGMSREFCEVVMGTGGVAGGKAEEAGGGAEEAGGGAEEAGRGLLDNETFGGVWSVRSTGSPVLTAALGGPFWFPSGPGDPFLSSFGPPFFPRPGPFESRAMRAFLGNKETVNLRPFGNIILPLFC
jgi:hypothetical protein